MDWKTLALSVPLLFVFYQAISKSLPKDISIFLVNAYASFTGVVVMLMLYYLTSSNKTSHAPQGKWVGAAIAIGILISVGNFGIIKAYNLGAPQALFTAIFYVALIVYAVLFGLLVWNEHLKPIQLFGIAMAASGVFIAAYFRK